MNLLDYSKDKIDESKCIKLPDNEKLDYCIAKYKDDGNTVFMAHFICSRMLWRKHFKLNPVLSANSFSEGIDLSSYKKLVIINMDFKTSKHTQRMARQANHNRTDPIVVDVLVLASPCIGGKIYESVAIKEENFVKNSYERAIE